jgi:hypothetical protein
MSWDGEERRSRTDADMWNLLRSIDKKLDMHLEEEKETRPKIQELLDILAMSKGAVMLIKILLIIGAPLAATIYWIKDHVKL